MLWKLLYPYPILGVIYVDGIAGLYWYYVGSNSYLDS